MSKKNNTTNQKEMSFIEKARRTQIVECAIETIAEVGYAQASLGQIAKRAQISKGVISYHFASKGELLEQVIYDYYMACQAYTAPLIENQKSPIDRLSVYIESNLRFIDENRQHVFAVIEIVSNERTADGKLRFAADHDDTIFLPIENILTLGMQAGVFREFTKLASRVMALTIRNSIDGFTIELMRNPQLNVEEYTRELITIFDKSTKK
ncbi:TetR family transcriptional regulator [Lysinibacillus sp. OL1_EC]|uniref:TetR/AcrR family transcriptional regulator n=1 Tax=unclassified Lysinibacillus TaxID=2636778 RepID=UPI00103E5BB3|nr:MULTISPECIES: TetR family transcriptional regulator [unclassified Lysinibacillus]MCM0624055.1 TetR family transcriptional regulator [Lysinibacillus sp. OL1_EC]MCS5501332.1 TetR family transcriptional regulator [Lysinibacillus sp. A4]TBV88785.1 TetR family transcriptional regulator [Lysinibacillus sp. OL1]UKJ43515.1 TetR family transcriptional regulator [Lysinibacillus sp. ACHW1.5]WGT37298.1 TetR family transcriptional regulator [Lysinibacillus sp. 1 U-2021]